MNWKKFKEDYVFGSPLDLKKLFPNYFNKWVLRSGSILMFCLLLLTSASTGGKLSGEYFICSESSQGCYLDHQFISPGDCYGDCPNALVSNFSSNMIFLLLLTLLFNAFVYFLRTNRLIPVSDPVELKKWNERFGGE